jgi:hypothetical protein
MSKYVWKEPKRFAVIRRWKDDENDFQVLEYFQTADECKTYIAAQGESSEYKYEVAKYE